jgi:hypothetical protein
MPPERWMETVKERKKKGEREQIMEREGHVTDAVL